MSFYKNGTLIPKLFQTLNIVKTITMSNIKPVMMVIMFNGPKHQFEDIKKQL
jgi:hypothetical protein